MSETLCRMCGLPIAEGYLVRPSSADYPEPVRGAGFHSWCIHQPTCFAPLNPSRAECTCGPQWKQVAEGCRREAGVEVP